MHACFSIRMLLILYERTFETLLISPQSFHINLGNKILTSHYHLGHVGRHRRLRPWLALWITKVKNGLFFFAWSKWCRVLRVRKSFVACFSMTQGLNMPRCKTFTLIRVLSSSTGWQPRETSRAYIVWGVSCFPLTNNSNRDFPAWHWRFSSDSYRSYGEHYHSQYHNLRQWLKVHCLVPKKFATVDFLGSKQSENRL